MDGADDAHAVFRMRGVSKIYRMGEVEVRALDHIDLDLYGGEFVVLLGASGSGKSTLVNILGGLDTPSHGTVWYRDHDLTGATDDGLTAYRREHVGFVFQFYNLIPSLTAAENVALVTEIASDPIERQDQRDRIECRAGGSGGVGVVKTLDKKLLRDLWRLRGQLAAIALVAMCGTATFITMAGAYDALVAARDSYYRDYRFADVFAHAKRAPRSLVTAISEISGVAMAEDRLMMEVTLDVSGFPDPASGLVVSVPDVGRPRLNDVHVVAGRYLTANAKDEVLLGQGFADAHRLRPGDSIAAVVNGRWQRLHIAGIANSPEFVYVLSGAAVFPDNQRYGVMWMNRSALRSACLRRSDTPIARWRGTTSSWVWRPWRAARCSVSRSERGSGTASPISISGSFICRRSCFS